ncbi:MAG TPA: biotin/lipoyl-containing protein, partial [Solirubrobacterales bacterium]|nr:biotin/lipoyl-containing protein [Solirubrobacterales bacterium]
CEKYIQEARHVEVQVLGDKNGIRVHLGERDCSVQRRHQKLIEEAPAPHVDEEMRERIGKIATDAAEAVDYRGAGTVEGMQVGEDYFFLEMNTRVQVEHCVTEMVTGIDIVREQIRIAAGEPLSIAQDEMVMRGHAIECRINAEAAHKKFAPAPGRIGAYLEPSGPGVRVDSGLEAGGEVTPLYDPMVAKLITWDVDRETATRRMIRALGEYEIEGLTTLIPFHETILATEQWARGETCRDLLEDPEWIKSLPTGDPASPAEGDDEADTTEREYKVEVGGRLYPVKVIGAALGGNGAVPAAGKRPPKRERKAGSAAASGNDVVAPLQGSIFKVEVAEGDEVDEGALLVVIEAMKMENEITAHKAGKVTSLAVEVGASINAGDAIATIE